MPLDKQNRTLARALPAALLAALALRLVLGTLLVGYPYDYSTYWYWGEHLLSVGPAAFYTGDGAEYPPAYVLVLGLLTVVRFLFGAGYDTPLGRLLMALPPILGDLGIALLAWRMGRRWLPGHPRFVRCVVLFILFDPLFFYDSAVWKQADSPYILPLLVCFCLLEEKRWMPAAFTYGLALALKPQALLAGPVLAVCFLAAVADAVPQGGAAVRRAVGRIFGGAAAAVAPALVCGLPFFGLTGLVPGLVRQYLNVSADVMNYGSINAFNWLAALGGNWQPAGAPSPLGPSWQSLGTAGLVLLTAALAALAVHAYRRGDLSPLALAAFYTVGVFVFAPRMHERYITLGVGLALLAALRRGSRALYGAGFGLSVTGFLNLAAVCAAVDSEDQWFFSATGTLFVRCVGLAVTVLFVCLAGAVWDLPAAPDPDPAPPRPVPTPMEALTRGAQPRWQRRELAGVALLTAAAAVLSFAYLGDTKAPQNGADANGGQYRMTVTLLPHAEPLNELWVYPGISVRNSGMLTVTDSAGGTAAQLELNTGAPFSWHRLDMSVAGPGPYTVTVTDGAVLELCFRDAAGEIYPLEDLCRADPLFDEQALVPDTISQLNGFYFDEIYHARTAYEQLHAMPVYETTHPPLGKDLMMLGIALFGMTGFGWRFSGTLFGVLLVPLAWCFARRLTRRRWAGALAGVLLALDFMRFAQSRLATVDVFATFFILLGAHCMLWYCQTVLQKGVTGALAPMALGGLAFGLGCAAKWTGLYTGVGLAVLYFGVLWARYQQKQPGFGRELRTALAGGMLFYLLLPLCIYLASYLPYLWRDPGFGLDDWWAAQVGMFRYHAGLASPHAFESRWYTWLLGLRPVWYYANNNLPAGLRGTIAGLGGPVLWLAGLAAVLTLLWRQVSGRGNLKNGAGGAVLVLYAAQLVPWMLVTRSTFLYHYFPSAMFCLAAIAAVLAGAEDERRARRAGAGLCAASLVLFVLFYPALSGLPVPAGWINALHVLPSFGF